MANFEIIYEDDVMHLIIETQNDYTGVTIDFNKENIINLKNSLLNQLIMLNETIYQHNWE